MRLTDFEKELLADVNLSVTQPLAELALVEAVIVRPQVAQPHGQLGSPAGFSCIQP